jgi:hypothetical protein
MIVMRSTERLGNRSRRSRTTHVRRNVTRICGGRLLIVIRSN